MAWNIRSASSEAACFTTPSSENKCKNLQRKETHNQKESKRKGGGGARKGKGDRQARLLTAPSVEAGLETNRDRPLLLARVRSVLFWRQTRGEENNPADTEQKNPNSYFSSSSLSLSLS